MEIKKEKKELRKQMLQLREQLSADIWEEASRMITEKLCQHSEYLNAETVLCYVDMRREVSTRELIKDAWKRGKHVAVPRVHGKEMDFYEITSFSQLEEGHFGVLEPKTECKLVCPGEFGYGIAIVPGAAFDKSGNRIGYGGGYYDKYFAKYPEIKKIALAYEFQMVSEIKAEVHDFKVNSIITEKNSFLF